MTMAAVSPRKGNRLFRIMVAVSVLIHVVLFLHVSGLYRKAALTVMEVSMEEEFKPEARAIPRPRPRPKTPDISDTSLPALGLPDMAIEPERPEASREIMETVAAPPVQPGLVEGLPNLVSADTRGLLSKNDYYDLVRMRIEASKIYPETARARMIEGKVTVRFTVTLDGEVSSVSVAASSGNRQLDQAAVQAVSDASPFSRPPGSLFKGPLKMEITVAFELT